MTFSRRQLLRDSAVAASLLGMPAMRDALFLLPARAADRPTPRRPSEPFVHPGIFDSADDLAFIRERIRRGDEPWKSAWEKLRTDTLLAPGDPKPVVHVIRGPYAKPDIGSTEIIHDSGAAHGHALVAVLSPDAAEAETAGRRAAACLDAWSGTLRSIEGHDQKLLCGMTGHHFATAAELLRHAESAPRGVWSDAGFERVKAMLRTVFLPPIHELFPDANGNWDAAMMTTLLAIAILTDDHALFDHATDLYHNGGGNGAITNYVYPSGQNEETTRDQGHVHMGIGNLASACRMAWVQGVDLYSAANDRLALGFEYTAKYNLGEDVPCDGGVPGPGARGKFAPVYEAVYQHYAVEKGIPMPYTRRVVEQCRPDGFNGAFPSWSTLTTCRVAEPKPAKGDILADALARTLTPGPADRELTVTAPSGALTATIGVRGGKLTYSLKDRAGRVLLRPSTAEIAYDGGGGAAAVPPLGAGLTLWDVAEARRQVDRERFYGEQEARPLPFEQRILVLRENAAPHRILRAELRVYDAGIALRLTLPPNRDAGTHAKTAAERTGFAFPEGATFYAGWDSEDEFRPAAAADLKPGIWLPLTVRTRAGGPYLSILEVDETNNGTPQTLLSPAADNPHTLVTAARGPVAVAGEESTPFPWRVVLTGDTPARLSEAAAVARSLWPAPAPLFANADHGWVRPGKAIREVTLSTDGARSCIDFAAAQGISYILFDAGWYGKENDDASDASKVARTNLDLPAVIAYGKSKGIGVLLYVNRRAAERQIDALAPLYESWGVAGIKLGFVTVGTAENTAFLKKAADLCARHRLLLDIHDAYRPVGLSGLYPNLLTQEGVRGNEHMPTPRHNCTLPFTRFLSGPADYTICYRFPRLQTTDAHQMALSVLFYSPLTLVYWYGKPAEYGGLPETDFFRALPTVWDETVWLGGEIGEWAAVARRSGRDWFVAAITNETARTVRLPLDFLPRSGGAYTLRAYADVPGAAPGAPIVPGVSRVAIAERQGIRRGAPAYEAALPAAGGIALHLTAA